MNTQNMWAGDKILSMGILQISISFSTLSSVYLVCLAFGYMQVCAGSNLETTNSCLILSTFVFGL